MPRNLGQIRIEKTIVNDQPFGICFSADTGELWKDHAKPTDGCIYALVGEDGSVFAAGPDPAYNLLAGYDVWEIEGDDFKAVIGKKWDGKQIIKE